DLLFGRHHHHNRHRHRASRVLGCANTERSRREGNRGPIEQNTTNRNEPRRQRKSPKIERAEKGHKTRAGCFRCTQAARSRGFKEKSSERSRTTINATQGRVTDPMIDVYVLYALQPSVLLRCPTQR
ncbi:unnamed protein product, partial [Pylaiella littoralis]